MTTSTATTMTTTERCNDDGDVVTVPAARLWDVYQQQWVTRAVDSISDEVLASLPPEEREMILAARA